MASSAVNHYAPRCTRRLFAFGAGIQSRARARAIRSPRGSAPSTSDCSNWPHRAEFMTVEHPETPDVHDQRAPSELARMARMMTTKDGVREITDGDWGVMSRTDDLASDCRVLTSVAVSVYRAAFSRYGLTVIALLGLAATAIATLVLDGPNGTARPRAGAFRARVRPESPCLQGRETPTPDLRGVVRRRSSFDLSKSSAESSMASEAAPRSTRSRAFPRPFLSALGFGS